MQIIPRAGKVNLRDTILLITRPRPAAERFRAQAENALGPFAATVIAPLQRIVPLPLVDAPQAHEEIILTSENGALALRDALPARTGRVWCVGQRTAQAARQAGFDVVDTRATAAELADALLRRQTTAPLVHVSGRHRQGDLAAILGAQGRPVRTLEIYDQEEVPLPEQALALLRQPADIVAPLFSPRSAALLSRAAGGRKARLHAVPISSAAARNWEPLAGEYMAIATRPDANGVIAAINSLFDAYRLA